MRKKAAVKLKQEVKTAAFNLKQLERPHILPALPINILQKGFLTNGILDTASVVCFAVGFTTLGFVLGHMF